MEKVGAYGKSWRLWKKLAPTRVKKKLDSASHGVVPVFLDWSPKYSTWEPETNILDERLIQQFGRRHATLQEVQVRVVRKRF
jgi:hypothetical protein